MTRLLGPEAGDRLVYIPGSTLAGAAGRYVVLYAASTGGALADVLTYDGTETPGAAVTGSQLTVDGDSLLPLFWYPDGVDTVWADGGDGRVAIRARSLTPAGGDVIGDLAVTGRLSAAGIALPLVAPSRRSLWRDASSVVTAMQTGHGWTASGAASSNLNDTTTFVRGSQSASMTTNGTGTAANLRKFAGSAIDLTGKALRLVLRISDPAKVGTLSLFAGTSALASNFKWRFNSGTAASKIGRANEWIVVTLQFSELNTATGFTIGSTGVPSVTSGFTDLQLQVTDLSTGPVTVWLQAVEVIDASATAWPKGIVSVTFDDSNSSAKLALPKMDSLGFRGTQYTIADVIGTGGALTLAELRSLQTMSGWEIAGHSYTATAHNARYTTLTAAQVDDDLRNLRAWLVTNGFTGDSFAYPGGQYELTTDGVAVDELVARYFGSGRTILSSTGTTTHTTVDAVSPAMPHRLRAMSSVSSLSAGNPNSPAALVAAGGMLDKIAGNGGWLSLVFHQIVVGAPASQTECSQTDFNTIMDGIASRAIPVLPVSDVVQRGGV